MFKISVVFKRYITRVWNTNAHTHVYTYTHIDISISLRNFIRFQSTLNNTNKQKNKNDYY